MTAGRWVDARPDCRTCRDSGTLGSGVPCGVEPCPDCVGGAIIAAERYVAGGPATFSRRAAGARALELAAVARDAARQEQDAPAGCIDRRRLAYLLERSALAVQAAGVFRTGGRGPWVVLP